MICAIYDYETLGHDPQTLPILSLAVMQFDTDRFTSNPYSFDELVGMAKEYKFDIEHQVTELGRKIDKSTLKWWSEQPAETRDKYMKPTADDLNTDQLYRILNDACRGAKMIFTRGNTFDPVVTTSFMSALGEAEPYDWWNVRDTRSFLNGMAFGSDIPSKFIPEGLDGKFKAHDACHDIAMDVMRMQTIAQVIS